MSSTAIKDITGQLDERISIETYTNSKDVTGTPTESWAEKIEVSARIRWATGNELDILTKETAETIVNFDVAYRRDLDTRMRIVFEGNTFDILGLIELDALDLFMTIKTRLVE